MQSFLFLILFLSFTCFSIGKPYEYKTTHFIIFYDKEDIQVRTIAASAEKYYNRIINIIGLKRHDNFWTWENRAKIYLFGNCKDFLRSTHAPHWASGKALVKNRTIALYAGQQSLIDNVLPHELTHLVIYDYFGEADNVPLWFIEGLAQYIEKGKAEKMNILAKNLSVERKLWSLNRLQSVNSSNIKKEKNPYAFYVQSASLIKYIIDKYGKERFRVFCVQLKSGKSIDEALMFTYPQSINNMEELIRRWKKKLES